LAEEGISILKPLLRVAGLPLIERTILTAHQVGLQDFYIVAGYGAETLKQFLSEFSLRRDLKITVIQNGEWEYKANGVSVLKARKFLGENFILLMADHIFEQATLIDLMKEELGHNEVLLAADFNIRQNKLVDAQDVTKVSVEGQTILDIGKNIEGYDAYDTGMFLCSPAIFDALEQSCRDGDTSLSGGVRILAEQGRAKAFDIAGRYWMDIDTPADRKKFSTRIFTPLILRLFDKVTANQISLLSAAVAVVAGLCFFLRLAVVGGIMIQLASILDGSDGEIARLKKMQSSFGNFLDAVLDRYADGFILFGMFYYSLTATEILNLFGPYRNLLVVGTSMLAILGNVMVSYTSARSITDFGYRYRGGWIAAGRGRDLRLFVLFVGGVLAWVHPIWVFLAILVIAILTNAITLRRLAISRTKTMRFPKKWPLASIWKQPEWILPARWN